MSEASARPAGSSSIRGGLPGCADLTGPLRTRAVLGSSRDELKQLADLLHSQLSGIVEDCSVHLLQAQAKYITESRALEALDWLLAYVGRDERPRSRQHGGSKRFGFFYLGQVISELPADVGLRYFEKALSIIEGLDRVAGPPEAFVGELVRALRGGEAAVREAMFDRAAATLQRLLQRPDCAIKRDLHDHDPVEQMRRGWRQSVAPPAPRSTEDRPPVTSRQKLLEDLRRVEKEGGPYNGIREGRRPHRIFARALRSGDEALIQEIEQRIMLGYTTPPKSSLRSAAALQADWVAAMCEAACEHAPERARAYFVDAVARARADEQALSAVMTLTRCVPTQEPGKTEAARELLGLLEERPNAPGYVAEYICGVLIERGFLGGRTRRSLIRTVAPLASEISNNASPSRRSPSTAPTCSKTPDHADVEARRFSLRLVAQHREMVRRARTDGGYAGARVHPASGHTTFMTAYTGRDEQGCAALVSGLADWRRPRIR